MTLGGLANLNQYGSMQGTSGGLGGGSQVQLLTPLSMVWRREVALSSTAGILSANTGTGALEADPDDTDIPKEGEWVKITVSSSREVASLQDTAGAFGYLVYAGRGRKDIPGSNGITVLVGPYVAQTNRFDSGSIDSNTAFGTPLMIKATTGILTAATVNKTAVATFEGMVTRNGVTYVQFASIPGGMWYEG